MPVVRRLIDGESYCALHAPRQVGKSTSMLLGGLASVSDRRLHSGETRLQ